MKEYEMKVLLSKSEYAILARAVCEGKSVVMQTNYYFDTDDFWMNKKNITCRIRKKDGTFKTTIKRHNIHHPDSSIEVDLAEKNVFDKTVFCALGLKCQGKMVTNRTIAYKDPFCEMVFDRNSYLGHTDFELEVEYCAGAEKKAMVLVEGVGHILVSANAVANIEEFFSRIGKDKPKSQRFFERKKQRRVR